MTVIHPGRGPRGLEHVVWPARRARNKIRGWLLWNIQGRSTDLPTVIRRGELQACPHGKGLITGWHWDPTHIASPVDIELLWDRYSAKYPVQRVDRLSSCTFCRALT